MTDYKALADYTAIHQRVAGWPVWLAGQWPGKAASSPRENDQWPEEGLPAAEGEMPSS